MKKAQHLILTLAATVTFASQAVEIRGYRSCGQWVEHRKIAASTATTSWFLGFLSGLAAGRKKDFLKGTESASIFLWVDNYCQANPLKDLDDAAEALFFELVQQKRL